MKRKLFAPEQIVAILQQAEAGTTSISEVCRQHGITEATFYRWRRRYQGMTVSDAKELKRLADENSRVLATPSIRANLRRELAGIP